MEAAGGGAYTSGAGGLQCMEAAGGWGGHLLDGMEEGCPNMEVWYLRKKGCPDVKEQGASMVALEWWRWKA